jgi:UDP-glucose 4-epimerase
VKVLVTGAGGNLGRVVVPALTEAGHDVRAADFRPLELAAETVRLDVRDAAATAQAVEGVDAIVHAAALHGVHLARFEPQDFWATNVTGTFNVYDAARMAGVRKLVLCSSIAVYGRSGEPAEDAWAVVTEDAPPRPKDVYGLSKQLCEEIARYHARAESIRTTALRLGMFVPETFERYGLRLLFGGVDDRDVAQAVLLALEREPRDGFDYVNVIADTPLDADDAHGMAVEPAAVVERHWPGSGELLREHDLDVGELVWGWALWPIEKAKRELGYRPRYGFDEFLAALRSGDRSHYPFAGLAQWGMQDDDEVPGAP